MVSTCLTGLNTSLKNLMFDFSTVLHHNYGNFQVAVLGIALISFNQSMHAKHAHAMQMYRSDLRLLEI